MERPGREGAAVLGIFAKQPRPGHVKSRLAADTSPAFAACVAEAFLRDTAARLAPLPAQRVIAYDPPESREWFAARFGGEFELCPQAPGDLGERMCAFLREQFGRGVRRVVLVGTDSPTLPPAHVEQAFAALAESDLVLGPATDGGYYLLGCGRLEPQLFQGIAWGSERVLAQTVERLQQTDLRLTLLPPWYDVDTLTDWRLLRSHVAALRRAGIDPSVPHTERLFGGE